MAAVLTKTRQAAGPLERLADAPEAEPKARWRLVVPLIDEPDEKWTGVAFPDYGGGLISERQTMNFYDRDHRAAGVLVDLEGETSGDTLKLTVFMIDTPFRHGEVVCTGQRVTKDFIEGPFEMACVNPEACGCGGMRGTFWMRKEMP
jgi:hypothetical protein